MAGDPDTTERLRQALQAHRKALEALEDALLAESHHASATRELPSGDSEVGKRPVGVVEGPECRRDYYYDGEQDQARYDARNDGGDGVLRYDQEDRWHEQDEAHDRTS